MVTERLKRINRIILSIGHGGGDTGAVWGGRSENEECRDIVADIAARLVTAGVSVWIVPDFGLEKTIQLINSTGNGMTDWAIEIHKDSTAKFNPLSMSRRMGVYAHPEAAGSFAVAAALRNAFVFGGAGESSWARTDTDSPRQQLAFIRRPKMLSHIVECGFIEDNPEREFYARTVANAILKILEIEV